METEVTSVENTTEKNDILLTSAQDDAQNDEVVSKVEVAFLDNTVENLLGETFNKALLDCGCTRTVYGLVWFDWPACRSENDENGLKMKSFKDFYT